MPYNWQRNKSKIRRSWHAASLLWLVKRDSLNQFEETQAKYSWLLHAAVLFAVNPNTKCWTKTRIYVTHSSDIVMFLDANKYIFQDI